MIFPFYFPHLAGWCNGNTRGFRLIGGPAEEAGWTTKLMWYVYVLKSLKTGKIYTGFSENLKRRIREHNNGKVDSTKSLRPLKLIYYESFAAESDARKEEIFLKTGYGREILKLKIKNSLLL